MCESTIYTEDVLAKLNSSQDNLREKSIAYGMLNSSYVGMSLHLKVTGNKRDQNFVNI